MDENPSPSKPLRPVKLPYWLTLFQDSLIARIAALLLIIVTLTTIVLLAGIERYVAQQFNVIHEAFLVERTAEVKQILDREGNLLLRSIELATSDSDLIHSVHYNLNLRGEGKAMREDVDRIARTFGLSILEIKAPDGSLVASYGTSTIRAPFDDRLLADKPRIRMIWYQNDIWALAITRLPLAKDSHAILIAGRPLGPLISSVSTSLASQARDKEISVPDEMVSMVIEDAQGAPLSIYVSAPNPARAALAKTKTLVIVALASGSVLLLVVITLFLRLELRPIASLTAAVKEFGQGKYPKILDRKGPREIADLVHAFNQMVSDIQRLRNIEQKMHHDRQLASIGKLAAKVAHDINNPLTVVANITRLQLHEAESNDRLREDLQTILRNCERCSNIADNLLRFSKPLSLKKKTCELGAVCHETAEFSRHRLPGLNIKIQQPASPVFVEIDPAQIERVLDNLINNAYQACPDEEVVIEYGIADQNAYIAVIDQGRGFTMEAINHLFEPFFTTKLEGSGLGLASCLAIIHAHGGELKVTAADKGHLTVWLPLGSTEPG